MSAFLWLQENTQKNIFCCDRILHEYDIIQPRDDLFTSALMAFISAIATLPSDLDCLSEEPKVTAIKESPTVVEVFRHVQMDNSASLSGGLPFGQDFSARYFVPSVIEAGKYVEVYVKDLFRDNPAGLKGGCSRIEFACGKHLLPGGVCRKIVTALTNPMYQKEFRLGGEEVTGKWLKSGNVQNWGD